MPCMVFWMLRWSDALRLRMRESSGEALSRTSPSGSNISTKRLQISPWGLNLSHSLRRRGKSSTRSRAEASWVARAAF